MGGGAGAGTSILEVLIQMKLGYLIGDLALSNWSQTGQIPARTAILILPEH